jgi:acetate kinase
MNILVLNCGSSSLKFQIIETDLEVIEKNEDQQKAKGLVERIGSEALISLQAVGQPLVRRAAPLRDHRAGLEYVLRWVVAPQAKKPGK